jgi:hypothetical protein
MKLEGTFSGVISSGLVLMGDLVGNKLIKPRVFQVIDNGKQMQLSPLPGTPHFVKLTGDFASWPIPDEENNKGLRELWERVTNPPKEPPRIVLPGDMGIRGN